MLLEPGSGLAQAAKRAASVFTAAAAPSLSSVFWGSANKRQDGSGERESAKRREGQQTMMDEESKIEMGEVEEYYHGRSSATAYGERDGFESRDSIGSAYSYPGRVSESRASDPYNQGGFVGRERESFDGVDLGSQGMHSDAGLAGQRRTSLGAPSQQQARSALYSGRYASREARSVEARSSASDQHPPCRSHLHAPESPVDSPLHLHVRAQTRVPVPTPAHYTISSHSHASAHPDTHGSTHAPIHHMGTHPLDGRLIPSHIAATGHPMPLAPPSRRLHPYPHHNKGAGTEPHASKITLASSPPPPLTAWRGQGHSLPSIANIPHASLNHTGPKPARVLHIVRPRPLATTMPREDSRL